MKIDEFVGSIYMFIGYFILALVGLIGLPILAIFILLFIVWFLLLFIIASILSVPGSLALNLISIGNKKIIESKKIKLKL